MFLMCCLDVSSMVSVTHFKEFDLLYPDVSISTISSTSLINSSSWSMKSVIMTDFRFPAHGNSGSVLPSSIKSRNINVADGIAASSMVDVMQDTKLNN
ncbi:hypothetical protein GJ496_012026 [Pomphorhynchus laevis]|nr:hypothetical protein GJ496_012026 [Pomphorhynchus laevis]